MKNICFIEGDMSRTGGTEKMTTILANKLSETNNVSVISLGFDETQGLFFELDKKVKHVYFTQKNRGKSFLQNAQLVLDIRNYLKTEKIDVVINVDIGAALFGIIASRFTDAKVITWENSNFFNNWDDKYLPQIRKLSVKYSDALVVLTQRDKESYLSNLNVKSSVFVIPNPAEKNEFNYDLNSKTIISIGNFLPVKRFEMCINAAKTVFSKHPDWKWNIFGQGEEKHRIESMIKELNLGNSIFLPGVVENIEEKYRESAMCVLSSSMEGLPMVLLEAKSYGLPLVSFDIMTGPSEIIRDGVNGFLVESGSVEELSDKITKLIESAELRKSFSDNSQLDMEKFDFNRIIEKWNLVLDRI